MTRLIFALSLLFSSTTLVFAPRSVRAETVRQPHIEAELVADRAPFKWGEPFRVALRFKTDPEWHVYWKNPGDSGEAPRIEWHLPEGFTASELQWPRPRRIEVPPLVNYGYEGEVFLVTVMTPPAKASTEGNLTISGSARWLVCKESCIPGKAELSVRVRGADTSAPSAWEPTISQTLAQVPRSESPWKAFAELDKEAVLLHLTGPTTEIKKATFFPAADGLIGNADPQALTPRPDGVTLRLAKSSRFVEGTSSLDGVVVLEGKSVEAYEVKAPFGGGAGLFTAILFAFLGGMILNLMPCVFPVLFIKILSFTSLAGAKKKKIVLHGSAYALGILASFWALAGALIALRAGGSALGWGFQLQSPVFLALLCFLMLSLSLNLLGVFEIGESWMGAGGKLANKSGYTGSFFSGVLATIVATPCTAPFMGSAMGYALAQPAAVALLVFTFLGLGLAFPYVFFSLFPQLTKRLPRPGAWMVTFKQAMAFPMLATAIWLVWVLGLQTGIDGVVEVLLASLGLSIAFWIYGKRFAPKVLWLLVALGIGSGSVVWAVREIVIAPSPSQVAAASEDWEAFSDAALEKALASNRPVFIDFTAAWCITCQVNERVALNIDSTKAKFKEKNVILLKADWTNQNEAIAKRLESYGRNGVPLYVLYAAGKKDSPEILPQILTPEIVIEALNKL